MAETSDESYEEANPDDELSVRKSRRTKEMNDSG